MSAWAFAQALTWGEIATRLSPEFMRNAAATFSAARVFHSWIGDTDHFGNAGNVVVNVESSETRPGVAFIDHAFSMSHNPGFVTLPVGGAPPISYITADLLDVSAAHGMVAAVNDLGPNFLEDTVRRIPAPFLPPDHGKDIIEGLLRRRGELAAVFGVAPV
ncbi:MAG: hypothetical protein WBQ55_17920 [Xanthobacteraceae bacterium]